MTYRELWDVYQWNDIKQDIEKFMVERPNFKKVKVKHQRLGDFRKDINFCTWKQEVVNMEFVTRLPRTH